MSDPVLNRDPSLPDPAKRDQPPTPSGGEALAAFGFALLILSVVLAWAQQPFVPSGGGIYPTGIPMPNLLSAESTGRLPSVGLVVVAFAIPGLVLSLLRWREAWVGATAAVLAALLVAVVVLFGLRWNSFFEGGEGPTFFGSLRAGVYVAMAGALLALIGSIIAMMTARRPAASEPGGLGVLPEDLA
jgi:hypothetical protein